MFTVATSSFSVLRLVWISFYTFSSCTLLSSQCGSWSPAPPATGTQRAMVCQAVAAYGGCPPLSSGATSRVEAGVGEAAVTGASAKPKKIVDFFFTEWDSLDHKFLNVSLLVAQGPV